MKIPYGRFPNVNLAHPNTDTHTHFHYTQETVDIFDNVFQYLREVGMERRNFEKS